MFGFRQAVLDFQANQLKINKSRQEVTDIQLQTNQAFREHLAVLDRTVAAQARHIDSLERQIQGRH